MTNPLANWWRSQQFRTALGKGDNRLAAKLLEDIQTSGSKLSLLEKQFRDKLHAEEALRDKDKEFFTLKRLYSQARKRIEDLENLIDFFPSDDSLLIPDEKFVEFILNSFKVIEHDENLLQCTGIEERIFNHFEAELADFLKRLLSQASRPDRKKFAASLQEAIDDINKLKSGQDPEYKFELSSHVYLMRYFPENVYCAYLAWFLIYKAGLLPTKLNILDIAAGPGTVAYGLALLLQSSSGFFPMPPIHVSYYSLELHKNFQFRGLQFWREYIEPQQTALNAYFRYHTGNIFEYDSQSSNIPKNFFDFIVISHCFFADAERRSKSLEIYGDLFNTRLKEGGYVLLIVQEKKLFIPYGIRKSGNPKEEEHIVKEFLNGLGLTLIFYKYLSSTGSREPIYDYGKFARKNLVCQKIMSPLLRQHFKFKYDLHYTLDDYVILAKR